MITLQKSRYEKKGYFIATEEKIEGISHPVGFQLAVTPQELLDLLKILEERKGEIEKEIGADR